MEWTGDGSATETESRMDISVRKAGLRPKTNTDDAAVVDDARDDGVVSDSTRVIHGFGMAMLLLLLTF